MKFSEDLRRRFLTELISSENLIFEIKDDHGYLALAVLLDKVNNPTNDACLEILGVRPDGDLSLIFSKFLAKAKLMIPFCRKGFQIGLPAGIKVLEEAMVKQGLSHYYDAYMMRREAHGANETSMPLEIHDATPMDSDHIYNLLCQTFFDSPDTSIPDSVTWQNTFLKSPRSRYYVWKSAGKILGFANLVEDKEGQESEIRTIGVLKEARGQGVGQRLLNHCVWIAQGVGSGACYLSVSVSNDRALNMYRRAGFEVVEKYCYYRISKTHIISCDFR